MGLFLTLKKSIKTKKRGKAYSKGEYDIYPRKKDKIRNEKEEEKQQQQLEQQLTHLEER
jgi:hypothetical protein